MAPATEVVLLTLVPGADYDAIRESAKILARQPGCLVVRTSQSQADGEADVKVHYLIDWDTVESHRRFAFDEEAYQELWDVVGPVMARNAPPYHAELSPHPLRVLGDGAGRGVALLGKAWLPGATAAGASGGGDGGEDFTPEKKAAVSRAFDAFVAALRERAPDGLRADDVASGWSLEDGIRHPGGASRVFMFAVGWDDVETCARFRASAGFDEVVSGISALEGLRELDVCVVGPTEVLP